MSDGDTVPTTPEAGPATAHPAATVLLVREGTDGPELFTITRAATLAFSAGVTAFPGGRVDPADDLDPDLWTGTDLQDWGRRLRVEPALAGQVLAAVVRETFEETGVLLARTREGAPVPGEEVAALPMQVRERIESHALHFGTWLTERRWRPDASGLQLLSRWVTPESEPRRYDTWFFVAALPAGQLPGRITSEGVAAGWQPCAELLADFRAGRSVLMPPTWAQVRALAAARSVPEVLALAGDPTPVRARLAAATPRRVVGFADEAGYRRDLDAHRAARRPGEQDEDEDRRAGY